MKMMYVDIGELGWSLYLSAHVRWRKRNSEDYIGIMTYPDRKSLYMGIADSVYEIPDEFYDKFKHGTQNCLGMKRINNVDLEDYFSKVIPKEYELVTGRFTCKRFSASEFIFESYPYGKEMNGKPEILIFPRYRNEELFNRRNLPKEFYANLIMTLCNEFPRYTIRTVGLLSGSYSINIQRENYINSVVEKSNIQDLIDLCQIAVCAIGGTSAPPKITLLQGVPTFIIGHEKSLFIIEDNWMKTKVGFYNVQKKRYEDINSKECIKEIISFIKEVT